MTQRQQHPSEIDFKSLLKSNLFTALYNSILHTFENLDDHKLNDLQQWIKEDGIYYVYMFICKNSYSSQEERNMIKEFSISPFDFRFIKQYEVTIEEIPIIFEKDFTVLEYILIREARKVDKERQYALLRVLTDLVKLV